ncbi:MAG TPA: ribonuclease III [Geobacteraceae bacterium]
MTEKNDNVAKLESAIAYRFANRALLNEALTHRSFLNETEEKGIKDNERLEFFGDAVIDFFLSHLLLERFPASREGELTKIRASLVGEENLADLARRIGLGRYLRLGRGEEKSGGREKRSILADAYEALVAAVYLDGGVDPARSLVEHQLGPLLEGGAAVSVVRDSKTEFQELAQALCGTVPRYIHGEPTGPDHDRIFSVAVYVGKEPFGEGSGRTKKEAEQAAAREGLARLRAKAAAGVS